MTALTIATAGLKSDQLEDTQHLLYPRVDYLELQKVVDTDILNYNDVYDSSLGEFLRRAETQLRSDVYLGVRGILKGLTHGVVFTMSERAGIPFAGLKKTLQFFGVNIPFVSMFQCWSGRQEQMITKMNLFDAMDDIIVHCQSMKDHFITLGVPAERIHVVHYSRDQHFFAPRSDIEQQPGFVLSVGETRSRDYATLFKAVKDLPLNLLVAASGGWDAREKNTDVDSFIPTNTTVTQRLSLLELRQRYAQAQFVVAPVYDTVFSAGATVVLESMSMGRAVVATRSQGILDYVIDGETGILVEPNNPRAMREAIDYLLTHPEEARRMGQNGRQRVERELNLDNYVRRLGNVLQLCLARHQQQLPDYRLPDENLIPVQSNRLVSKNF